MAHKSKIVKAEHIGLGLIAVTVRCCGDPGAEQVLTLGELQRDKALIDADIAAHQAKVEKLHADSQSALEHIQRLTQQ